MPLRRYLGDQPVAGVCVGIHHGKFTGKKYRREVVKVHAVPRELARNKERAEKFEEQWNHHVSPGNLWFYKDDGTKSMLKEAAEKGWLPYDIVRQKEVFM